MKTPHWFTRSSHLTSHLRICTAVILIFAGAVMLASAFQNGFSPITPLTPPPAPDYTARVEGGNLWFVELKSPPAVKGTSITKLNSEKQAFRQAAADAGVSYTERYAFNKLWNGFSIQVDPSQMSTITRIPGVKAVYPVGIIQMPKDASISPDLQTALTMTGADVAQSQLGKDGTGVKVAVMDTGIDYDHQDLGGDGVARQNSSVNFPNLRVTTGYDLVGDSYNADSTSPAYQPVPQPDAYPDDCAGHGTHVAGIVGANGDFATGGARGVAPGVTFGAYRVFGCVGSTTDDVMIAAMERVLNDHMNVLNMSIGDAFNNWPGTPTAVASDNLVDQGVVVVASIGNNGADGVWSAGAPGVGNKVIGVASYDNIGIKLKTFTVSPDGTQIGYTEAAAAPPAPTSGTMTIQRTGTTTTVNDGCSAANFASITPGSAVLIRRGTCGFYQKAFNAQSAGAAAVVLYNNVAGRVNPTVAGSPAITIPVVAVSDTEGALIDGRIASGPTTITWTDQLGTFANPTGGLVSSFSSYGLGAELGLKPDIGAPGGFIRSTYPLEAGAYATISGTSMASPHVAGAAALLLQSKSWTSPTPQQAQDVRGLLQNTAVPAVWSLNPGLGFLEPVHRQGAGMLKIDKAILAPVSVTPGKISLGEAGSDFQGTLNLANSSATSITYDLSHVEAIATAGTFNPLGFGLLGSDVPVTFSAPSVTVPANGAAAVGFSIGRPDEGAADKIVDGGYLVLTPQGGGQTLRIPYSGFAGNYQAIPILTSGGATPAFPKLAKWTGFTSAANFTSTYTFPTSPITYTMAKSKSFGRQFADIPVVAAHFDHQARVVKVTVLDAAGNPITRDADGQTLDPTALSINFMPRNQTAGGYFAISWDGRLVSSLKSGKTSSKNMPNGNYQLRVEAVKPLGDANNPADIETYTSPTFTIARPL